MKFREIVLQTRQLNALEEFYSSVIELPVGRDVGKISVTIGLTQLVFQEINNSQPFYHFAINIPSNKIEEARQWLKAKVELLWMKDYNSDIADFKGWNAKSVYFYDPAGNIVELISRFDLNDPVEEKFSSKYFNCISEIGVVFNADIFNDSTNELLENFQLNYFSKQSPLPQFRAIGDDYGLFIIVPANRNWYPTDKPAGIFPMEIEFEENRRNFKLNFTT